MAPRHARPLFGLPLPAVLAAFVLATLGLAAAASAQTIPIKTVPVATGDQFLIFPSDRLGMGSLSIAIADTVGDPFVNPATLHRLADPVLFSTPTGYGITDDNGGAITLPVGGLFGGDRWQGGVGLALQELDRGRSPWGWGPFIDFFQPPSPNELSQKKRTNLYGFGAIARRLGDGGAAVGASVSVADLAALGGVDLLYGRQTVDQGGHILDLRLGLTADPGDGTLEAVLLHSRLRMRHELIDQIWEPVPVDTLPPETWFWEPRWVETTERDETDTWGLHLGYRQPLAAEGWQIGAIATVNYKSHPKIPNYTLMSIPRDPGDSWAYDLGIGIARRTDGAVFGVDLVYEPIWTETWADAATALPTTGGDTIPAGHMTVFNDFRFNNAILRMGVEGRADRIQLQAGLQVRAYRYTLDQTDFVREQRRRQRENWIEWTPSLAVGLRFDDFAIRYTGRVTTGTGRPGVVNSSFFPERLDAATLASVDFIPAPSGALTLDDAVVHTHQLSIAIPIGH